MAILSALQETTVHPTADWVYSQLKPKYPDLSLGTVYRNLKKFCETGKAASVGVIGGQEHFDANTHAPRPPGVRFLRGGGWTCSRSSSPRRNCRPCLKTWPAGSKAPR